MRDEQLAEIDERIAAADNARASGDVFEAADFARDGWSVGDAAYLACAANSLPALIAEVRKLRELENAMLNVVEASLVTPYRSTRPEMQAVFDVMEKLGHLMPKKAGHDA